MRNFCSALIIFACVFNPHIAYAQQRAAKPTASGKRDEAADSAQQKNSSRENTAQAKPSICSNCEVVKGKNDFLIDARPGYFDSDDLAPQSANFKKSDRVRVVIKNMNPFLYDYTVKIDKTPVAETAIPLFFSQFSQTISEAITAQRTFMNILEGDTPKAARTSNATKMLSGSPSIPKPCEGGDAQLAFNYLRDRYDELRNWERTLLKKTESSAKQNSSPTDFEHRYHQVAGAYSGVMDKYQAANAKIMDQLVECQQLYAAAEDFQNSLAELKKRKFDGGSFDEEVTDLEAQVEEFERLADEITEGIKEFDSNYSTCKPKVNGLEYFKAVSAHATSIKTRLGQSYKTPLTQMPLTKKQQFEPLDKTIRYVFEHWKPLLLQEFEVGGYDTGATVTVTVERRSSELVKNVRKEAETASTISRNLMFDSDQAIPSFAFMTSAAGGNPVQAKAAADTPTTLPANRQSKLEFGGGPRFSFSAGIVVSSLGSREYQSVLGKPLDRNGAPTNDGSLKNVVGVKENSSHRVSPLLMLNTRIWQTPRFGLHGSFGVTGKHTGTGTNIDYFFGPSLSFLENKVFFTVGPYIGKRQRLAGDLFQNFELTSPITIPVQNEFSIKPGVSFTYKIK